MRSIKAATPELYKLALLSRQAEDRVNGSKTPRSISKAAAFKFAADSQLVSLLDKLASDILNSLSSNKKKDELEEKLEDAKHNEQGNADEHRKTSSITPRQALLLGAGIAAPSAIAGNMLLNKASDSIDSKMMAIPGLAAATVAAVLAAKNMDKTSSVAFNKTAAVELGLALTAKQAISKIASAGQLPEEIDNLKIANHRHIAALVTDILLG